jgi:hypothetical protein
VDPHFHPSASSAKDDGVGSEWFQWKMQLEN